jgi:LPXTG-motif cell wall-anchored protein
MALVKEILWAALFWAGIAYAAGFWSLGAYFEEVSWKLLAGVGAIVLAGAFWLARKRQE